MPTLTITKTYSNGNTLTEAMLDAIKSSIETFINTTKLDADNIQDSAITAAKLASNSVTAAKIDSSAVTAAKLDTNSVTTAKIADSNVTGAKIESNVNLPGSGVQVNGKRVITANTNAAANLAIVRLYCNGATSPSILSGEGATVSRNSTGSFTMTFDSAFADIPTITSNAFQASNARIVTVSAASTTAATIVIWTPGGATADEQFFFQAIGQRA
jgi:hypothetical protein